jgi:rod shape-determining protein MreB and related proteins
MFRDKSFAIDIGNNNTLVSNGQSILLAEPSYIVINEKSHSVKAVGGKAFEMFEKAPSDLRPVKPLKGGVIADHHSAEKMIYELVHQVFGKSYFSGYHNIVCGVPFNTTKVERRALRDVLDQFNSRKTYLLFEPLAAAIGMDLDIQKPEGKLVIDIGGGITEIVVVSLSGIAAFQSLKVAGDSFDEAIQDYFRRRYNFSIGKRTAERIKIHVGAVLTVLSHPPQSMRVMGKDLVTGIPVERTVGYQEVAMILEKSISAIEESIIQTLEKCPPELASDIYQSGIYVTGGGALLRGLKERLESSIKLKVNIDTDPLCSVSKGTSQVLQNPIRFRSVLIE